MKISESLALGLEPGSGSAAYRRSFWNKTYIEARDVQLRHQTNVIVEKTVAGKLAFHIPRAKKLYWQRWSNPIWAIDQIWNFRNWHGDGPKESFTDYLTFKLAFQFQAEAWSLARPGDPQIQNCQNCPLLILTYTAWNKLRFETQHSWSAVFPSQCDVVFAGSLQV